MRVAGAVLAGGASRRMGTDKALLAVEGRLLVDRALDAFSAIGVDDRHVVGAAREWPHELLDAHRKAGITHVPDRWPGAGPLGGIISALIAGADADLVVVLPCDLAVAPVELLKRLVAAASASGATGAVAVVEGRVMAVVGAFRTVLVGPLVAAFDAGERRADAVLGLRGVVGLDVDAGGAPVDLDDPADVARWVDRVDEDPVDEIPARAVSSTDT